MKIEDMSDAQLLALYEQTYREVEESPETTGRGVGVKIYPIMNIIPRTNAKKVDPIQTIYCPGKNQTNAFRSLPDPREMLNQAAVSYVAAVTDAQAASSFAETITVVATESSTSVPASTTSVSTTTPAPTATTTTPAPAATEPTPAPAPAPAPASTPAPSPDSTPSPSSGGYY